MKTYFTNGTMGDVKYFIDDLAEFQIQELAGDNPNRYIYPGDTINYTLDSELVKLYDVLRDLYFDDVDRYYEELAILPIWVQEAGQNSDCAIDVDLFCELINAEESRKIPNLYKHLYLVDCQFLVGTIQNLLSAMEDAFVRYYMTLANMRENDAYKRLTDPNGTICIISEDSRCASALLETYFIKAYSILDILCKICYEIQEKQSDFSQYKKIKSADVLWGFRKKLLINETENTLFEKCDLVSMIESLRNESVHNGTWELNPKIFVRYDEGIVGERFMLFPDMLQGRLATVKSRKHFFSKGIKVNSVLPCIHAEFKQRLLQTLVTINGQCLYTMKN